MANLHVRKCGGTSVRKLFSDAEEKFGFKQVSGYCASAAASADIARAEVIHGRNYIEVHCDEDIGHFVDAMEALRPEMKERGCKLVTTLLMRDPVDQLVSEWAYAPFHVEPDKQNSSSPVEWAARTPENELRWLLKGQPDLWDDAKTPVTIQYEKMHNGVADCDKAVAFAEERMETIDVVGVMDTPVQFAQWWLTVGEMAGFNASAVQPIAANPGGGIWANAASALTEDDKATMAKTNSCSMRVRDEAVKRLQTLAEAHGLTEEATEAERDAKADEAVASEAHAAATAKLATGSVRLEQRRVSSRVTELVRAWGGQIPGLDGPGDAVGDARGELS